MEIGNYFLHVVQTLGNNQAYFPGTGGNISLKFPNGTLTIKASGKRVLHMTEGEGVVSLKYKPVVDFFEGTTQSEIGEKESNSLIISLVEEGTLGRPSIETGFHTLLGTAVIHSHSAYANLLTCSVQFEQLAETIFFGSPIKYLCLPYAKPGYFLTHTLLEATRNLSSKPRVFFMQNHGIIVSAPSMEEAVQLHEEVNDRIRDYFSLTHSDYPKASLLHLEERLSESRTPFLTEFIKNHIDIFESLEEKILFPDLSVFCDDLEIVDSFTENTRKITIERSTGLVRYSASKQEAHCIEENFIAHAFLFHYMKVHHLQPVYISKDAIGHIRSMEQEKYRKLLIS